MNKNVLVAQSGGPTTAINASLAGVIKGALASPAIDTIYGGLHGIEGILQHKIANLSEQCNLESDIYKLACTPAMALGSCRMKMKSPEETPEVYEKILEVCKKLEVGYFFYIGGNDSMDTVAKLSQYCQDKNYPMQVVGVPKTIDNDLVLTDHTPGFGSAAKYVISSIMEVARDTAVYAQPSAVIVEIMGRDAGFLAASSAVARVAGGTAPHMVYIPEIPFVQADFLEEVREAIKKHNTVIIATSEGIRNADGTYAEASDQAQATDGFGHAILGGVGAYLENLIKKEIGCKVRSIELSTLQRGASHCASKTDIDESIAVGCGAVAMAVSGKTAVMAAIKRLDSATYKTEIVPVPVADVANKVKKFPVEWIQKDYSLSEEGMNYFLPLIQGEVDLPRTSGVQDFFVVDTKKLVTV
ncbi:MAG: 6-phosphofructokinase [Bacillota bacterium]